MRAVSSNVSSTLFALEDDDIILGWFKQLKAICEEIELPMSVMQLNRAETQLRTKENSSQDLLLLINSLTNVIDDELSVRLCMIIPSQKANYYEKLNLFGNAVSDNFPSAGFDIEESGKCLATSRNTACVMHLQRVVERGLKGFGNYLGIMVSIKSAQPSWQNVLDLTAKEIKDRTIAKTWISSDEQMYSEGIQSFLVAVKNAWRNPSMHADQKYTEEIAEDIFNAVKGFMRHLAEHLDESGNYAP
jgi:hypothetical protein